MIYYFKCPCCEKRLAVEINIDTQDLVKVQECVFDMDDIEDEKYCVQTCADKKDVDEDELFMKHNILLGITNPVHPLR